MIEVAFAQLRLAASLALGLPFSQRSLNRIIDGLLATQREFGSIERSGAEVVHGPQLDPAALREVHLRRFRSQARLAARDTRYYRELFGQLALNPARLRWDDLRLIPATPKQALRERPDDFVRRTAQPTLNCTTTGTTGQPTSVCFSNAELQTYIAFNAMGHLVTGDLGEADILHIATSTRAVLGNTCAVGAALRVGALVNLAGLIDPAQTLALLAQERSLPGKQARTSALLIYPSYLGELVETGLALGYRPADFGLKRIYLGGEIVTAGLRRRSEALFGPVIFHEGYGMTETWPCNGTVCPAGHLHFEPSSALVEVCDPTTGATTPAGAVGTMIVTPLPPFRSTTLVLRYNTEDLVQTLTAPPTCSLHHLPAVAQLLGKERLAVNSANGWIGPRSVLEALEALDCVPLPARCGFWAVPGGIAVEVMARGSSARTRRRIDDALAAQALPVRELHIVDQRSGLRQPLPWRSDLKENTFAPRGRVPLIQPWRELRAAHTTLDLISTF